MSRKNNLTRNDTSVDDIFNESNEKVRESERVVEIPKHTLYSKPQVREVFNQDAIDQLRLNIEAHGQRQPCRVAKIDDRGHLIQEGERRWRAIMDSDKITHVKCIIGEGDLLTQVSENILREDLNAIEEGNAYSLIKSTYGFKHNKEVAEALGISEAKVSAAIKAAKSPDIIQTAYFNNKIGDVDTINSLRIAFDINPKKTEQFLSSSTLVSRKEAQELTKQLKSQKKAEKVEGVHAECIDTAPLSQTNQGDNKGKKTKSIIKQGIRIRVDERYGVIDLTGQSEEGDIVILFDGSSVPSIVAASDVIIVGYHIE